VLPATPRANRRHCLEVLQPTAFFPPHHSSIFQLFAAGRHFLCGAYRSVFPPLFLILIFPLKGNGLADLFSLPLPSDKTARLFSAGGPRRSLPPSGPLFARILGGELFAERIPAMTVLFLCPPALASLDPIECVLTPCLSTSFLPGPLLRDVISRTQANFLLLYHQP